MTEHPPARISEPGVGRQTVRAIAAVTGVVVLQGLLLALFAWPIVESAPRDLPVAVAGPAPAAQAIADKLAEERPGAFDVTVVDDAAAADEAIREREVYGALVVTPAGLEIHVASAASPAVAQLLTQLGQAAAAQLPGPPSGQTPGAGGGAPKVVDVVPSDVDDPRGAAFPAGILPLIMTSLVAGVLLFVTLRSRLARLVGALCYGAFAGLAAAAVLQYWLGVLPGAYLENAATLGLLALAMSAAIGGLGALLGAAGIGLGSVAVFMVGNPLSGLTVAPEMLPQPWGEVGQYLPPGAGGTLLRSVAYFDMAGANRPALVLGIWAATGLLLLLIGRARAPGPRGTAMPATT